MPHPKIKEYSKATKEKLSFWKTRFYNIGTEREKSSREFQFLFLSWFSLLLFFTFFILAEKNPFNLLVPFNVFQWPRLDSREEVKIVISDGSAQQISVSRKILIAEEKDLFIYQLVDEVGAPPYFSVKESSSKTDTLFQPKKLLNLQFALKKVWIRKEGSELILDWNTTMLESVMNDYRLPRLIQTESNFEEEAQANAPVDTITYYSGGEVSKTEGEEVTRARRLKALALTFKAVEATLFLNFPNLKTIEHRLDGFQKSFEGLEYSLGDIKQRPATSP